MIDDDATPSPHQLADNPELAILAALDRTLLLVEYALLAAHAGLRAERAARDDDPAAWTASLILVHATLIGELIERYRRDVDRSM